MRWWFSNPDVKDRDCWSSGPFVSRKTEQPGLFDKIIFPTRSYIDPIVDKVYFRLQPEEEQEACLAEEW